MVLIVVSTNLLLYEIDLLWYGIYCRMKYIIYYWYDIFCGIRYIYYGMVSIIVSDRMYIMVWYILWHQIAR